MSATRDQVTAMLAKLPQLAARVAQKAAPLLAARARAAFDSHQTPYGNPWRKGITLYKSGALRAAAIAYLQSGAKIKSTVAQVRYAKYHIREGILPRGGQALPAAWEQDISREAQAEFHAMGAK